MNQIHESGEWKKKGAHNHPDTGGSGLLLERRTMEGAVRLVTLSWEMSTSDFGVTEFLETLHAWRAQDTRVYDMVVCAGRTPAETPSPADILAASGGVPVLYEVWGGEASTWCIAYKQPGGSTSIVVRAAQLVFRSNSDAPSYDALASVLAQNKGVIRFNGFSLPLVLFICGENNALEYRARGSVLWRSSSTLAPPKALCNNWVALNLAHKPYCSPVSYTGFAKIARTNSGKGPTLGMLVKNNTGPYRDKTLAPLAVIHVNNFCPGNVLTEKHASIVFTRGNTAIADSDEPIVGTLSSGFHWSSATYSINEP